MYQKLIWIVILVSLAMSSCVEITKPFSKLPPGEWRGYLMLEDDPGSDSKDLQLPFNFEISYTADDNMVMHLINGTERIEVKDVLFGTNKSTGTDSVRIDFPVFDTHISGAFVEDVIQGFWYVHYRKNYRVPFTAYHGLQGRSDDISAAEVDIDGTWDVMMEIETQTAYPAIGEFVQKGNNLSGTFLTETGDYRYLDGKVNGDKFMMSCFDGSHAFYFDGDVLESGSLLGRFYSGVHYKTNWTGVKNDKASLTNPFAFSKPKDASKAVSLAMPNTEGSLVTLDNKNYNGKPKILKVMGTWCPNCMDATNFLLDYLDNNPKKDIDVIAIAFERYRDEGKALNALKTYKTKKNIPYEVLYGGYYEKAEATSTLNIIDEIKSYPTFIFLDKNNKIKHTYTGFNGPATSEFAQFKIDFDNIVTELLSE